MKLDFATANVVSVSMINYIDNVIGEWNEATFKLYNDFKRVITKRQRIATTAPDDLFKVNEDQVKLGTVKAKYFHRIVTMMLYVTK